MDPIHLRNQPKPFSEPQSGPTDPDVNPEEGEDVSSEELTNRRLAHARVNRAIHQALDHVEASGVDTSQPNLYDVARSLEYIPPYNEGELAFGALREINGAFAQAMQMDLTSGLGSYTESFMSASESVSQDTSSLRFEDIGYADSISARPTVDEYLKDDVAQRSFETFLRASNRYGWSQKRMGEYFVRMGNLIGDGKIINLIPTDEDLVSPVEVKPLEYFLSSSLQKPVDNASWKTAKKTIVEILGQRYGTYAKHLGKFAFQIAENFGALSDSRKTNLQQSDLELVLAKSIAAFEVDYLGSRLCGPGRWFIIRITAKFLHDVVNSDENLRFIEESRYGFDDSFYHQFEGARALLSLTHDLICTIQDVIAKDMLTDENKERY